MGKLLNCIVLYRIVLYRIVLYCIVFYYRIFTSRSKSNGHGGKGNEMFIFRCLNQLCYYLPERKQESLKHSERKGTKNKLFDRCIQQSETGMALLT